MSDWSRLDLGSLVNRRKRTSVVRSYPKREDSNSSSEWLCAHTYVPKESRSHCDDSLTYLTPVSEDKKAIYRSVPRKKCPSVKTEFTNTSKSWKTEVSTRASLSIKDFPSIKKGSRSSSDWTTTTRKRSLSSLSESLVYKQIGTDEVATPPLPKVKHEYSSYSLKRNGRTSQSVLSDVDTKNIIDKWWSSSIPTKSTVVNEMSIEAENSQQLSLCAEIKGRRVKAEKIESFDSHWSAKGDLSLSSVITNLMEIQPKIKGRPCSSDSSLPSDCVIKSPISSLSLTYCSSVNKIKSSSTVSTYSHHENMSIKSVGSEERLKSSGNLVVIGTQTAEQVDIDMDETADESLLEHIVIEDSQGPEIISQVPELPLHCERLLSPPKHMLNTKRRYTGLAGRLFSNMASLRSERAMARRDPSVKTTTYDVRASARGWGVTLLSLSSGDVVFSRLGSARTPSILTVALPLPKVVIPKYPTTVINPIIIHHR